MRESHGKAENIKKSNSNVLQKTQRLRNRLAKAGRKLRGKRKVRLWKKVQWNYEDQKTDIQQQI